MELKLHSETRGRGPELFMLHGWALHGGVWNQLVPELKRDWRVTCVDLPGHGRSAHVPMPATLAELVRLLMQAAPENAIWLGWSLGGLAALRAALDFPKRVRALILMSTTARFVTAPDWRCAMPPEQLQEFTSELARDYRGMVQRFFSLQVRGDEHARATLRQLRAALSEHAELDMRSMAAGLEILRSSDLRDSVQGLNLPTLVITGGYDRLTPPAAGDWLAATIRGAQQVHIPEAAHAALLSHPQACIVALRGFLGPLRDAAAPAVAKPVSQHG